MRIIIATLSIIFAACVIVVSVINYSESVTFHLWPDTPEYTYPLTPVSWVIFLSAVGGSVFMGVVAVLEGSKTRLSNARLRAQVQRLQQEITTLKRPSTALSLDDHEIPQAPIEDEIDEIEVGEPNGTGPRAV